MIYNKYLNATKELYLKMFNRNTLTAIGGLVAGTVMLTLTDILELESQRDNFIIATQTFPVYFILKGSIGNIKDYAKYLSPKNILKRDLDLETILKMYTAGITLHFCGEYVQGLSFGFHHSILDIHALPYLSLNIPAYTFLIKAVYSTNKEAVKNFKLE